MALPNADRAVVELARIQDYVLNSNNRRGRHKARVFASVLDLTYEHADELRDALLEAALQRDAVLTRTDQYGERYRLDFTFEREGRAAMVRSAWIVASPDRIPRLISCGVLLKVPMPEIPLFAEVALTEGIPAVGLVRGQVGAVVERLARSVYEVEFGDHDGRTYAIVTLKATQLMLLHHKPIHEAA